MAIIKHGNNALANVTAFPSAVSTGKPVLISTSTASSSASIEFTSGIDSTYDIYYWEFIDCHPATHNALFTFTASTNGGSSYGLTKTSTAFNAYNAESFVQAALGYNTSVDLAQSTSAQNLSTNVSNASDGNVSGSFYLFNPSSTVFVKHYIIRSSLNNGSYAQDEHFAGYINNTSAVDAIKFSFSSGNIDAGTIKMYGISA